ncbi:Glycosyl transferase family 2 [Selenomonas sp. GACV-9]|uniref:glycosyltransferase family 2 protein n=1 Tax=Selenomonas sp. GACV-9 TaxID=3158782 RepID=UPI0008EE2CCC|nr:Glycosyl transferase family 2 [Selenomonas ruminantium]
MKKIAVVSMVKNEADLIESFVRHSLTFADVIILADHSSSDKTMEILKCLQQEGLPVVVRSLYQVELAHQEVMNALLQEAIDDYGADIILPMDADEFLVNTENQLSCREILQQLDTKLLYKLEWRSYEPLKQHEDEDKFTLLRPCQRSHDFAPGQKTIVGAEMAKRPGFRLVQGCHFAFWENNPNHPQIAWTVAPYVHTAHYHWRSDEQYMAKIATSWINNVSKYSVNTPTASYLKGFYEKIRQGERIEPDNLLKDGEVFDLRPYVQDISLRYSQNVRPDVLKNLMAASVLVAESYVEEKIKARKKIVTVVIPYLGDRQALQQTLHLVEEQTYPFLEIFICNLSGTEDIGVNLAGNADGNIHLLNGENLFDTLAAKAAGDYVQWLLPGDSIRPDKIMKMAVCMETQDFDYAFTMVNGDESYADWSPYTDILVDEEFLSADRERVWKILLRDGKNPSRGIAGTLIRRGIMDNCHWFRDCFLSNRVLQMTMWKLLMMRRPEDGRYGLVGMIQEKELCAAPEKNIAIERYVWQQLEWGILLLQEGDSLGDEGKRIAQQSMKRNHDMVAAHKQQADEGLWQQYEAMLAQLR